MSTVAIFDEAIFDGPDMFDTRTKFHTVIINDEGGNVSDSISRLVKYRRELKDGQTPMFDGPDMFDPLIFDTAGGGGSILDSVIASKSNPVILVEAAIIVSDLLVRIKAAKATLSDTVASSDSLARVVKHFRTIVEAGGGMFDGDIFDSAIFHVQFGTINISDVVTAIRTLQVNLADTTTVGETLTRKLKAFRIITDPAITILDVLTRKQKSNRSLSDTTTNSDDLQRKLKAFRTFAEAAIISSDAIAAVRGAKVTLLENTVISDVLTRLSKHFRTFTEINTVSDTVTAFKVVGRRIKTAFAWINKKSAKAFIFKRKTNAYANKRGTSAKV